MANTPSIRICPRGENLPIPKKYKRVEIRGSQPFRITKTFWKYLHAKLTRRLSNDMPHFSRNFKLKNIFTKYHYKQDLSDNDIQAGHVLLSTQDSVVDHWTEYSRQYARVKCQLPNQQTVSRKTASLCTWMIELLAFNTWSPGLFCPASGSWNLGRSPPLNVKLQVVSEIYWTAKEG